MDDEASWSSGRKENNEKGGCLRKVRNTSTKVKNH